MQPLLLRLAPAGLVAGCLLAAAESGHATAEPAFENVIRLPQDLYTQDGQSLQQGSYRVRVQFDHGRPELVFESANEGETVIKGKQADRILEDAPSIPIAGTMFLRSTDDPVGTDAERHHSKTGHPQYQPSDAALAVDAFEVADQQAAEVAAGRQRGTAHVRRLELLAALFGEVVEAVLVEQFVEPVIKRVGRSVWQIRGGDPQPFLALPPVASSHCHKTIIH